MFDVNPLEAGAAYALYRHGQDVQTAEIVGALQSQAPQAPTVVDIRVHLDDDDDAEPINALDYATADMPGSWDDYIGQPALKREIQIRMLAAQHRGEAMPHTLLASGRPGVGKTAMARLIAKTMGVQCYEMCAPFKMETLIKAAETLQDGDVLFIDEIHLLAKGGGDQILLKVLEDKVGFLPDGTVVPLNDITIVGATTDAGIMRQPILDRFMVKPDFESYSLTELAEIAVVFAYRRDAEDLISDELAVAIAKACRNTPRMIDDLVLAARDLGHAIGRAPTAVELLDFKKLESDGLTRTDVRYLTAGRQLCARTFKEHGVEKVEYIVGEKTIMGILRETPLGLSRIERALVESGLIQRTRGGRRLTDKGIARAEEFIAAGKGFTDV